MSLAHLDADSTLGARRRSIPATASLSAQARSAKGVERAASSSDLPCMRQASLTTGHGGATVTQRGAGCLFARQ
ncbi:MAG: hypothetical protein HC871_10135 [Rhizobiales bacterium]|nr:hypothetical protein [Hyphomicrobiales bacterium]